jgi:cardiolipin synthase A/B
MAAPDTVPSVSSFRWLRSGQEGLEAMLQAVAQARRSICLETYIFDSSPVGQAFVEALLAACSRQVQVRLLVDAVGSVELPDSFWGGLRQAGAQVRWFNPITLGRITYRDHRKLLVVDQQWAVIGGFNIAAEYFGDGLEHGWRDLGLAIQGPLGARLAESFDDMFERADFRHKRLQRLRRGETVRLTPEPQCELLLSGPGRGQQALKRSLAGALAAGRTAHLISAYFLPPWRIRRELRRMARRGGQVQLILAGKTDVAISQLASRRLYAGLLRAGVEIYEYLPKVLHAKLFIVDDVVYAGSANLDARSLGINYELLVRVTSPELAQSGRDIFRENLTHCRRIRLAEWRKSRSWLEKLMENLSFLLLARLDPYVARWRWRKGRR